jgi:hypothetical protein
MFARPLACLALAAALAWPLAGPAGADTHPSAAPEAADLSYGCNWTYKRLPDRSWRPFLTPVWRACTLAAEQPPARAGDPQHQRSRAFLAALDRAARGLDALYLELWRVRLADEDSPMGTVALNDTGVFLALQHEQVFRLADRVLLRHGAGHLTAWR